MIKPHHDKNLVPKYILPDPFTFNNGDPVDLNRWPERRKEILDLFRKNTYGHQSEITLESQIQIIREVPVEGVSGAIRRDLKIIMILL